MNYKSARFAVMCAFFTNGVLIAAWLSRIPFIQDDLGLSESALGLALLGGSVGVISALTAAGGLISRYGSKRVTVVGAFLMSAFLPFVALMPSGLALAASLLFFSAGLSAMDVAMNAQAVVVEKIAGKPLMSSFHAMWSIGATVGAIIGSQMARFDIVPLWHFTLVGIVFALLFLLIAPSRLLTREQMGEDQNATTKQEALFRLPHRTLWILGFVAFAAAIGEGSIADWGAIYLTDYVGTAESIAAGGYAGYAAMMTLGRLVGDQLTKHIPPVQLVRGGGILATSGILLAIMSPEVITVFVGFAAVGLGLSIIIPLAFSVAGKKPGLPSGAGIAGVATIGYTGFLVGPPVIGLVAEATSLRIALLIVTALIASLMFTAGALKVEKTMEPIEAPVLG